MDGEERGETRKRTRRKRTRKENKKKMKNERGKKKKKRKRRDARESEPEIFSSLTKFGFRSGSKRLERDTRHVELKLARMGPGTRSHFSSQPLFLAATFPRSHFSSRCHPCEMAPP